MILIFAAEPNFVAFSNQQMTEKLLFHLENKEAIDGELVLPDALILFSCNGAEMTIKVSERIRLSEKKPPTILYPDSRYYGQLKRLRHGEGT